MPWGSRPRLTPADRHWLAQQVNLLRHRREQLGWSREHLCERMNGDVSVNTLAGYETCGQFPRLDLWLRWRAVLSVGTPELEQIAVDRVAAGQ